MKEEGDEESRVLDEQFQMASPPTLSLKDGALDIAGLSLDISRCSGPVFTKGLASPRRRSSCGKFASHYSPGQLYGRGAPELSPTAHLAKTSIEYLPDPLDTGSFEISSIL